MATLPRRALLFSAKAATAGAAVTYLHSYHRQTLLLDTPASNPFTTSSSSSSSTGSPSLLARQPTSTTFWTGLSTDLPRQLCAFVDASPSPHHVVANAKALLDSHGFRELREEDEWSIAPGGRYYVNRNRDSGTSLAAFSVGTAWRPGDGFAIVGTHVDSPCLRLKPVSARPPSPRLGFLQLGVELYGGGLWHTWFDRDLGLAGRVLVRTDDGGGVESRLVNIAEPLLRVPSLAAHYRKHNPLNIDLEHHLLPVLGSGAAMDRWEADDANPFPVASEGGGRQQLRRGNASAVAAAVAGRLGTTPDKVLGSDLVLYDLQPASVGGAYGEYVFGARLDNLFMTFCALTGFVKSLDDDNDDDDKAANTTVGASGAGPKGLGGILGLGKKSGSSSSSSPNDRSIRVLAMFDHEEIGSAGASSAKSTFIPHILKRLCTETVGGGEGDGQEQLAARGAPVSSSTNSAFERSMARSFFLSADMTHATHPAHMGVAERGHLTVMNQGLVISSTPGNAFMRNTPGATILEEIANRSTAIYASLLSPAGAVPLSISPSAAAPTPKIQYFVNPNDIRCGSTLGPLLGTTAGLRTLDVGCCQLSMHSAREMAGAGDVANAVAILSGFWRWFGEVDAKVRISGD